MTIKEFSDQFDTLLDSYKVPDEFGRVENLVTIKLDEYEKSVLLTEAQDMILKATFQGAFDLSEQGQVYFSGLITVGEGTHIIGDTYSDNGKLFTLPDNVFWILNERVVDSQNNKYVVKPINYTEYDRILSKAYAKPLKRQAWRLYQGADTEAATPLAEIVVRNSNDISEYLVRYIRKPIPIILEDLGDLTINNVSTPSECELHPIVHHDILNRAVDLALARYTTNIRPSNPEQ